MNKDKEETTIAATLKYDGKRDSAPRVTARGHGAIAEKIIELAKKHNVPIKEDPALAQILSRLDIDEQIPSELYKAVAEILAFVYSVNERYREAGIGDQGKD
ncbi:MAG: EscU/YscU/HrcU family type III secretion system export apparatus switch protein [Deltaproteobacteria bacterium]|nr:EscU/YscU/HrcU family type III secretion system export apparatus switch protein [Deltaproteobacteria bacterium]